MNKRPWWYHRSNWLGSWVLLRSVHPACWKPDHGIFGIPNTVSTVAPMRAPQWHIALYSYPTQQRFSWWLFAIEVSTRENGGRGGNRTHFIIDSTKTLITGFRHTDDIITTDVIDSRLFSYVPDVSSGSVDCSKFLVINNCFQLLHIPCELHIPMFSRQSVGYHYRVFYVVNNFFLQPQHSRSTLQVIVPVTVIFLLILNHQLPN